MKTLHLLAAIALTSTFAASAAVRTVTTTNNVNPPAGQLSLLQAITAVQAGDTIAFNIPGNGPHIIETPPDGYPYITVDNVTIDGYTQPGSSPNSNGILAANNADIAIVLDSRNGNYKLMDYPGDNEGDDTGFGDGEAAIISAIAVENLTVRGLSLLGVPLVGPSSDVGLYAIALAKGSSATISGNWFGVAPDGTTIAGTANGVSAFRYRVRDESGATIESILITNVVIGVTKNSTNAPAEFNVFAGLAAIPAIIEGHDLRFSGNFFMVLPDGKTDFNVSRKLEIQDFSGAIEVGRAGNNVVIGVDGDGVNDANERNIFGGVIPESLGGYDHTIEFYGQTPGTNIVVAGNYFGVGVDGTTRFENGAAPLNAAGGSAQYRFGSDFDGVSDALEGNVVYNYFPAETFPPSGFADDPASMNFFDELSASGIVSVRGNTLINNLPMPASLLKGDGAFLESYYSQALADAAAGYIPTLNTNSTTTRLTGSVPLPNTEFAGGVAIDVYIADPEGLASGAASGVEEYAAGIVQGKTYLGSFTVDGAQDSNAAAGEFDFDASALSIQANAKITITANYHRDPIGTHNAVAITSPFSPVVATAQGAGGGGIRITNLSLSGSTISFSWTGGGAPFAVQKTTTLTNPTWTTIGSPTRTERTFSDETTGDRGFYRVVPTAN